VLSLNAEAIGIAAALGSAASWALGSVLFKRLGDVMSPIALTFAKGAVGTALLLAVTGPLAVQPLPYEPLLLLVLSGLIGIAAGDTFFFIALRSLGAQAVVVLLTLGQVLTVLLAVLWLGERPRAGEWLGISLVVSGVATVMWFRLGVENRRSGLAGLLWGLLAVVAMAVSTIIAKEALDESGSLQATFIRMLAGTVGIFLVGGAMGQLRGTLTPLRQPGFAALFLASVVTVTFGGFWLSLLAIQKIDVAVANTLSSTEPLLVLPIAAFVLKESLTVPVLLGSALAVLGIACLSAPDIISPW
jgi:drug/metabolite transporter (DMT)-like permease